MRFQCCSALRSFAASRLASIRVYATHGSAGMGGEVASALQEVGDVRALCSRCPQWSLRCTIGNVRRNVLDRR